MNTRIKQKAELRTYYLLYTLVWCIMTGIIMIPLILSGKTLVTRGDGYNQFYPAIIYIREYIINFFDNLLNGKVVVPTYDFVVGYGEDILTALNHYGFGDVFMILTVLFPKEYMIQCYAFIILFKIYLSGITFINYGLKYPTNVNSLIIGSIMYAFSPFSLIYGMSFPTFLNVMITLPLALSGIDSIFERKICSYKLIIAIGLQSIMGFYFLYMETIVIVIYYGLLYCINNKKKDARKSLQGLLYVGVNYLIGICLGACVLIPVVLGYFQSCRGEGNFEIQWSQLLFDHEWRKIITDTFIPTAELKGLMLPVIILPCIVLYIMKEKKSRIFGIVSYMTLFIPAVGFIMNGFSYTTTRWYFVIYFISSCILIKELPKLAGTLKKKYVIIIMALYILLIAFWCIGRTNYVRMCIYVMIYSALFLIMLVAIYRKREKALYLMAYLSIGINIALLFFRFGDIGAGFSSEFVSTSQVYEAQENSDFIGTVWGKNKADEWRMEVTRLEGSLDGSLIGGYFGDISYYSMSNKSISDFFYGYEIHPAVRTAPHILIGTDNRKAVNSVLSILQPESNDKILPFAFTYNRYIKEDDFNLLNDVEKNEILLKAAVVDNSIDYPTIKSADLTFCSEKLSDDISLENIHTKKNVMEVNENSKILLYVENPTDGEIYVKLDAFKLNNGVTQNIQVGESNFQIGSIYNNYYVGNDNYLINAGYYRQGNQIIEITFPQNAQFSIPDIELWIYPEYEYKTDIQYLLNSDACTDIEQDNDKIKCQISSGQEQLLYFNIPYSEGWSAWDNGIQTDIIKTNIGFSALMIKKGTHEILLKYQRPGYTIGLIVSAMGVILFMVLVIFQRSIRRSRY